MNSGQIEVPVQRIDACRQMRRRQIGTHAVELYQRIAQHIAHRHGAEPVIILWIVWRIGLGHAGKDNAADTIISLHCC